MKAPSLYLTTLEGNNTLNQATSTTEAQAVDGAIHKLNPRYFAQRSDGDLAATQFVKAGTGHSYLARQAFSKCVREFSTTKPLMFFSALRQLLGYLGEKGYGQHGEKWRVPGGKLTPCSALTHHQVFATWASVQRVVSDWIYDLLTFSGKLASADDCVFKGNDAYAVMHFLFSLTCAKDLFLLPASDLEGRALKCLEE